MRGAPKSGPAMHVLVFLLMCAALLCTPTASALDPNKRLTQYIHTAWRTQDGSAPSADMISITQTSDGFLWFVSSRGLYRFDGARFVPWTLPAGVLGTRIVNIFGDRAGGLWVVMRDEILHLKGGVVISRFELSGVQSTQNISEDSDGTLWLARGALNSPENPLCHVSDQALKCFGKEDGIPISPINSLLSDGKGGFWLGGFNVLVHWHGSVSESYPTKGQVVSLVPNADGSLVVGMLGEGQGRGLARWKNGSVSAFVTPTFNGSKVAVTRIISDRTGNLWVGTEGEGVFRIHGTAVEHCGHTEGLSSDTVWTLFEDRDGIVWAATPNGLDSFRDPAVTIFSSLEGLTKDAAAGILATKDGSVWVANDGSLDRIVNETVSSIRMGAGLPGQQVTSMLEDRTGNLWVGVDDSLYLYNNGRFRRLPSSDNQPLGMVVGITEDIAGNIWAECSGKTRRLVRIRDFRVQEQFTESQVPAGHSLAADPKGGIWIGTLDGEIALFRNGILEKKYPLNLTGESAADLILPRADGSVLAGSTDGLFGLHDGKPQRLGKKNGIPCNWTYSFIEDRNKNWWLSTECGIVELSDSEFQKWWANPETIVQARLYDTSDGARPSPPSFNSAAYSADGRVWFATGVVVQMVDPPRLRQELPPAQTYIESVIADRKQFDATDNLRLAPHLRDLQIDYTSPTFTIPQRVKFRYRLDNYDHDWHDAGTRRQAFYTDLPPGKYAFRVIAANSDGVWNESAAKLDFSVAPAYYQTNWFRAVCAAAFVTLLWVLYQLRLRQVAREFQMTLDTRVAERTRIARDLHDTLLQSFHGILLYFQTGINLLPEHPAEPRMAEARKTLEKAMHQAQHAIVEGREAIQGLRSSVLEKNDLALAIQALGEELAVNSNSTAFQVNVEGTARDLHPIVRDEIYRITGEAMRNAFRHAEATQIEVEIHYDERRLRVRVRDDGKGVDEKLLADGGHGGHFGLRGMRERATLIGGKLTIWSELYAGTEVELSVPAAGAYTSAVDGQSMSVTKNVLAKISGRGTMKKS